MLNELSDCRGNGTSLITIMIQQNGDLNGMNKDVSYLLWMNTFEPCINALTCVFVDVV